MGSIFGAKSAPTTYITPPPPVPPAANPQTIADASVLGPGQAGAQRTANANGAGFDGTISGASSTSTAVPVAGKTALGA